MRSMIIEEGIDTVEWLNQAFEIRIHRGCDPTNHLKTFDVMKTIESRIKKP